MKKSLALMLALIMVLCMIPTTALAADIIAQNGGVYIYKGEPQTSDFLQKINDGSITKSKNEEVIWQRLPRYTNICRNCGSVLVEVIPDYRIDPVKNIEIEYPEVIGEYGVRVANWKGGQGYDGNPCFEFYCNAAKAGETDVKVTYYYNYNYPGESGSCNRCGNFVYVQPQTNWYQESVTFHVKFVGEDPVGIPDKPTDISGIVGESAVKVHCTNDKSSHADETFALIAGSFTIGDVTKDNASGKYSCNIAVRADQYVGKYNTTHDGSHTLDQNEDTAVIKLEYNNEKWEKVTQTPVVFNVKCETVDPTTGSLTIEKVFTFKEGEDPNTRPDSIRFTVQQNVQDGQTGHSSTVTLDSSNGWEKTIKVPVGEYTVTEGDAKIDGYTYTCVKNPTDNITVAANKTATVTFTNTYTVTEEPKGMLTISKTVEGLLVKKLPASFTFTVVGSNTEQQTVEVKKNANNGYDAVTIKDMPYGTYTITESNANVEGYNLTTSGLDNAVTIDKENPNGKVNVTNAYTVMQPETGTLTVKKTVTGKGGDKNKEFKFTVTLVEPQIIVTPTSAPVSNMTPNSAAPASDIKTDGGVNFTNGVATFTLKDGESKTITGIPAGMGYTVTESDNEGYSVTKTGDTGAIEAGKTATAAFTNNKDAAPTPTPGGGNGSGGHWHPTTTPVPVIVIPPKTGDMTIWQSILHFLGIR